MIRYTRVMSKNRVKRVQVLVEMEDGQVIDVLPHDIKVNDLSYRIDYDIQKIFDDTSCELTHSGEMTFSLGLKAWTKLP